VLLVFGTPSILILLSQCQNHLASAFWLIVHKLPATPILYITCTCLNRLKWTPLFGLLISSEIFRQLSLSLCRSKLYPVRYQMEKMNQTWEKMKIMAGIDVEEDEEAAAEEESFMDEFNRQCTLSTKQRFYGFAICFVAGLTCTLL
ncbi:hypothetical protein C5167_028282, partial [Papaver somniferum]